MYDKISPIQNIADVCKTMVKRVENQAGGVGAYRYEIEPGVVGNLQGAIPTQIGFLLMRDTVSLSDIVYALVEAHTQYLRQLERATKLMAQASDHIAALRDNGVILGRAFAKFCKDNGISDRQRDEFMEQMNDEVSHMNLRLKSNYKVTVEWKPVIEWEVEVEAEDEDTAQDVALQKVKEEGYGSVRIDDWFDYSDVETTDVRETE